MEESFPEAQSLQAPKYDHPNRHLPQDDLGNGRHPASGQQLRFAPSAGGDTITGMTGTNPGSTSHKMPGFFIPHGGGPCFFMDWNLAQNGGVS
jgi:hypothetical protein